MAKRIFQTGDTVRLDDLDPEASVIGKTFESDGRAMVKVALSKNGATYEVALPTEFLQKA